MSPDDIRRRIVSSYEKIANKRDREIVEGGRSVSTGSIVELTDFDIATLLDGSVILIASYEQPESIDELLVTAELFGDRLHGVLFNGVSSEQRERLAADVVPYLETRGMPVLGMFPLVRELTSVPGSELSEEIRADILHEKGLDEFVDTVIVESNIGETALPSFTRAQNVVVITEGDRPSILTAAIEAPSVNCLLLTDEHRPSNSVLPTAESRNVPVLLIRTDTNTTIQRTEVVISARRTGNVDTVTRMQELLIEHTDPEALVTAKSVLSW